MHTIREEIGARRAATLSRTHTNKKFDALTDARMGIP
jgi:hypothetical protein